MKYILFNVNELLHYKTIGFIIIKISDYFIISDFISKWKRKNRNSPIKLTAIQALKRIGYEHDMHAIEEAGAKSVHIPLKQAGERLAELSLQDDEKKAMLQKSTSIEI